MDRPELKTAIEAAIEAFREEVARETSSVKALSGGILASEAVAFLCLCRLRNVDLVVESGRSFGYSTRMFNQCVDVVSIEEKPDAVADMETYRMRRKSLTLAVGNGMDAVPHCIRKHASRRIAILLDGPKGKNAVQLLRSSLPSIVFGAIHDLSELAFCDGPVENESRKSFLESFPVSFLTDELPQSLRDLDRNHVEVGGYSSWEEMTAYGYTLGFVPGAQWGI